jgi:flagellar basal body rod protein FlgG
MTTSIQQDIQRINVIANNLANALTGGYKRTYLTSAPLTDARFSNSLLSEFTSPTLPPLQSITDYKSGVPRQTSGSLDVAILGEGYFEVRTDSGNAYTRQGNFRRDEQGRLVTNAGLPVEGASGDIVISTPTPTIDREGRVFDKDQQIAQIKIVAFSANQPLESIGGGLFSYAGNGDIHKVERPSLVQGQLESSNVDSAQEMVKMLETFRHFEVSHKVLQGYDDLDDNVLKNLGQF